MWNLIYQEILQYSSSDWFNTLHLAKYCQKKFIAHECTHAFSAWAQQVVHGWWASFRTALLSWNLGFIVSHLLRMSSVCGGWYLSLVSVLPYM